MSDTGMTNKSLLKEHEGISGTDVHAFCHKPRPDLNSATVRQYLEQTVAPILLHGLRSLAQERPTDPVTYLATYLLNNKDRCADINVD
ncbi:GH17006 [Drosophila grimshawi]|uniref:GH17006 n=1 Tax=Drosophila grimshawi TaxID=7222 RepID=B4IYX5_DROGR|nr:GH17006 [Drosophila grimshawi]